MELCTRNLFHLVKLWINNFIGRRWKDYTVVYEKNNQKCGAVVMGSFTTTMPLPPWPWVCSSFWQKKHERYPSSSLFTRPCAMWLFPVPSYERPDERETFCWCQRSEKENTRGLEKRRHWRVPEMFSAVGTSVSSQKESTMKETRVVIV